ncbi:MAG: HNH endonuclease signature motif containing protein, partial [Cetobacterium sp.]
MNPIIASKTKQIFNGKPYYLCGKYFQNDGERLHRTVYAYHKGPIPKGFAVHHIDEDRSNNNISNLMLMRSGEHTSHHHHGKSKPMPEETLNAAAEWHGSEEGLVWHKEQ